MEVKHQSGKQQNAKDSVLQGNGNYFNRILSRESSVSQSFTSIQYYRSPEGVPFKWEMQPGTPKNNPLRADDEMIPPPSPSPLMQSQGFPKPSSWLTDSPPPAMDYTRSTEWLRKKFKKLQKNTRKLVQTTRTRIKSNPRIGDSTREFSASNNSYSSKSSSLYSGHGRALEKDQEYGSLTCNPMSGILDSNKLQDKVNANRQKKRTNKMCKSASNGGSVMNHITHNNNHVSTWSKIYIWIKRNNEMQEKGNVGQVSFRLESTNLYPPRDLRSGPLCKSISSSSSTQVRPPWLSKLKGNLLNGKFSYHVYKVKCYVKSHSSRNSKLAWP